MKPANEWGEAPQQLPPEEHRRYRSLARAGGDLLLEVDAAAVIRFAAGDGSCLPGGGRSLVGRSLLSLFTAGDRPLVARLLGTATTRRFGPLRLTAAGAGPQPARPLLLSGYAAQEGGTPRFLSLSRPRLHPPGELGETQRDAASGLLARRDFTTLLGEQVAACLRQGLSARLLLLELRGLAALLPALAPAAAEALQAAIGTLLRAGSADGQTAGRLDRERFGLLQCLESSPAALRQEIEAVTAALDPLGKGVAVLVQELPLTAGEADPRTGARVVGHVLRRFLEEPANSAGSTLAEGLQSMLDESLERVVALEGRIDGRRLTVALQPIVGADDRRLRHYEALARFDGRPSPARTISLAESSGLILDLDLLVVQQVGALLGRIAAFGEPPRIAVNLSASSLESDAFVEALRHLLQRFGPLRRSFAVELTESTRLTDLPRAERVIQQLRRDGHAVGLDDFGAGAASFPYIQALAVDFVKLDGLYVQRLLTDRRSEAILRAMIGLCRELEVATTAEMVETEAQLARLRELGVDCVQGYLFGRPVTDPDPASLALPIAQPRGRNGAAPPDKVT